MYLTNRNYTFVSVDGLATKFTCFVVRSDIRYNAGKANNCLLAFLMNHEIGLIYASSVLRFQSASAIWVG